MKWIPAGMILLFSLQHATAQQYFPDSVGIGIQKPTAAFEVRNSFKLGVTGGYGGTAYSIGFTRPNAQLYGISAAGLNLGGDGEGVDLNINPAGNVGIGKTASDIKLDINGNLRNTGAVTLLGPGTSAETAATTYRGIYLHNGNSTAWDLLTLQNNSGVKLKISGDGNVGIGTLNPKGYKLAVDGVISGRKIKVTQESWPDYVFHPNYTLRPLEDVETFVKKYHHLPDIPSETDIKTNGLDVGETNKLLLQKIEELTLYIIEMKKEIKELKK